MSFAANESRRPSSGLKSPPAEAERFRRICLPRLASEQIQFAVRPAETKIVRACLCVCFRSKTRMQLIQAALGPATILLFSLGLAARDDNTCACVTSGRPIGCPIGQPAAGLRAQLGKWLAREREFTRSECERSAIRHNAVAAPVKLG